MSRALPHVRILPTITSFTSMEMGLCRSVPGQVQTRASGSLMVQHAYIDGMHDIVHI